MRNTVRRLELDPLNFAEEKMKHGPKQSFTNLAILDGQVMQTAKALKSAGEEEYGFLGDLDGTFDIFIREQERLYKVLGVKNPFGIVLCVYRACSSPGSEAARG
jgi:hypothetical protein